jgi:hypothetical protein
VADADNGKTMMSKRLSTIIGLFGFLLAGCPTRLKPGATLSGTGGAAGTGTGISGGGASGSADASPDSSKTSTISIVSPPSPVYTNQTVVVTVEVGAGTAGSHGVQLLENGVLFTTLSAPPYTFSWDTTTVAEGSYQLVAQVDVDGEIVASAPLTVVVDRTPPTIVSRSPDSGASNVSLTDPIQVVFSEPLAATSVTASAIALAMGSTAVDANATLEADGKTVTVGIVDRSALALPGAMTEVASATITDLAGNTFAGMSWNFSVPLWVSLGTVNGSNPQMVLDSSSQPIVATIVTNGSASTLQIAKHLAGLNWDTSSIPSPQVESNISAFGMAGAKTDDLYFAWTEHGSGAVEPLHIGRWTGSSWDKSYGQLLNSTSVGANDPAIAVTVDDQPVVRWSEQTGLDAGPGYLSRWTGTQWSPISSSGIGVCDLLPCRLILDSSGDPITGVIFDLARWTGSSWARTVSSSYGLAINSSQQAITLTTAGSMLQAVAISTTGSTTNYVPGLTATPASYRANDAAGQVVVDSTDAPVVSWLQEDGTSWSPSTANIHVARWTGAAWDQAYGTLPSAEGLSALALWQGSVPIVAWQDFAGSFTTVAKSNH